jgi:ribosome biogenesis GTPase / thiamine phosphate phosphatase
LLSDTSDTSDTSARTGTTTRARVARVDRSAYDVLVPGDPATRRVPALASTGVTVGDWLVLDADDHPVGLEPRTSLISRGTASGTSHSQLLAANVDVVLLCAGLTSPPPLRRLERLLALAWESGATPVVVLTKADACADPDAAVRAVEPYAPGVEVIAVSAATGDLGALRRLVTAGTTMVLLGASGAGKSTLVNALAGAEVMVTQEIRDVDGKGRHTTTHRELVVLPSGAVVIDTPGLRGVALHGDAEEGLARAFSDVEDLASGCRFADCGHVSEPGCAVTASIEAGDLPADRLESWRRLQRELAYQARRTDTRLQAAEKAKWRAIHREQRQRGGRP